MSLIVGIGVELFDATYRTTKTSKDRYFACPAATRSAAIGTQNPASFLRNHCVPIVGCIVVILIEASPKTGLVEIYHPK